MMALRKSVSWAVVGFAITGAAYGQVPAPGIPAPGGAAPNVAAPGITDGSIVRNGQIETETATEAPTPAAAAAVNVDITNSGAQTSGDQNGSNATTNLNPFGATFDSNSTDRLIIQNLQANSAASRLGLQAGDRIIELNGQTYTDVNQFDRDLAQLNANTDVPIIYERNGMRYTKSFRMSAQNPQQRYNEPAYGNQDFRNQSDNAGQLSHSAARPMYGTPSNGAHRGGMEPNQGYHGGAAAYGNHSWQGQVCCGAPVYVEQCGVGHHHGGRRHRRCCR